jgi:hypothetical protein
MLTHPPRPSYARQIVGGRQAIAARVARILTAQGYLAELMVVGEVVRVYAFLGGRCLGHVEVDEDGTLAGVGPRNVMRRAARLIAEQLRREASNERSDD